MTKNYYERHADEIKKKSLAYYYAYGKYNRKLSRKAAGAPAFDTGKPAFDVKGFDPAKAERFLGFNLSNLKQKEIKWNYPKIFC